jgi:hypothetical protein
MIMGRDIQVSKWFGSEISVRFEMRAWRQKINEGIQLHRKRSGR